VNLISSLIQGKKEDLKWFNPAKSPVTPEQMENGVLCFSAREKGQTCGKRGKRDALLEFSLKSSSADYMGYETMDWGPTIDSR
jgi:hypothetical protein